MSVGTMYQYFPHKQALFHALNERYLRALADGVEAACAARHGAPVRRMVEELVGTYWKAKTERPELTRALYQSVAELDNEAMIEAFAARVDAATAAMLASAPDITFAEPAVTLTLLAAVFGAIRNLFKRNLGLLEQDAVRKELVTMCVAYLNAATTVDQLP